MELSAANTVSTPGVKDPDPAFGNNKGKDMDCSDFDAQFNGPEATMQDDNNEVLEPMDDQQIHLLQSKDARRQAYDHYNKRHVRFNMDTIETINIVPYSEIYGVHPRYIIACDGYWKRVSHDANKYTGKSPRITNGRRHEIVCNDDIHTLRTDILQQAMTRDSFDSTQASQAPAHKLGTWERQHGRWICANRTKPLPKAAAKKRAGAKTVKKLERLQYEGYELSAADATSYRALSARGNYSSQGRSDIAHSAKE